MKNRSVTAALVALTLSMATASALAEDGYEDAAEEEVDNSHFYLGGATGMFKPDSERLGGNTRTLGAQVGYQFNDRWAVELGYQKDAFSPGEDDFKTWDLEFVRFWGQDVRFLIEFGFTHVMLASNGPDDSTAGFHFGIGASRFLTDNLELRGDAKLIKTQNEELRDGLGTISLNYHFGKTARMAEVQDEPALGASSETGAESLPAMDQYREPVPAEEPAPQAVEAAAPAPVAVAEVPAAPAPQEAPAQPAIAVAPVVAEEPAEQPVAAPVAPVAASGAPRSQHTLVNFGANDLDIDARYGKQLDQISTEIINTNSRAVVEGHTDSQGSDLYNKTLSVDRAIMVKRELRKRGVKGEDLSIVGYGEERPVASNDTEEGRQQNRRVEVKVYGK